MAIYNNIRPLVRPKFNHFISAAALWNVRVVPAKKIRSSKGDYIAIKAANPTSSTTPYRRAGREPVFRTQPHTTIRKGATYKRLSRQLPCRASSAVADSL
ncbi:hypothetical protein Cob_v005734 [Colletotrichum orbiculare MAFF 240422]|uniref:Uncharacterized protein n=1 Tax=Colletotrichum orbiculare (strain 104-T / ATCC 96160 / CBS 514.97 / LARS 414 / MAFF 240422) TaxID=1213857 RepID=A0A484FUJ4_COLOR|nr:hypothetical protein Cob_v005734 [Colletotrichum orbiculare MAFF 240422]